MSVKKLKMSVAEFENYLERQHINSRVATNLYGCCIIKEDIDVQSDEWINEFVLVERFDGYRVMTPISYFILAEQNYKQCVAFNAEFNRDKACYIYKDHYSRANYIPTKESIARFIQRYWKGNKDFDISNLIIAETNLSKAQFNSIQAKAKLVGTQSGLVDYNTYAVENQKTNKIMIYTMQQMKEE
jgi:hypothetical protein